MRRSKLSIFALAAGFASLTMVSCSKDDDAPYVAPSSGNDTTLNLIAGSESGANAANSLFVDFSTEKLSVSGRASWDLALSTGSTYKVALNYKTAALAYELTKTNLNDVVAADTVGLPLSLTYSTADYAKIDSISGDLNYTKIKVNAIAADNKVYIIQRGTGAGITRPDASWYKVRVLQNTAGGYTVQYAKITSTTFTSVDIAKNADYNFSFLSFDNGVVLAEPKKAEWDIQYTHVIYEYPYLGGKIPYFFSDMVLINHLAGVSATEVLIADHAYASITLATAKTLTYSGDRWAIADKWRTATSATAPGVRADRFYVVKDAAGNYYKLKFISFHDKEGGVRGKPQVEYILLK